MIGSIHTTTVNGTEYTYWADFIVRGTFAKNMKTGETKKIYGGGYIHNDLTVRKNIAWAFGEETFRK